MTFLKARSKAAVALTLRNHGANLSDKRVIPPGAHEGRIKGTLHLPPAPR